jgi:hypothetical protein
VIPIATLYVDLCEIVVQDQSHEGWYATPASLTVATAMGGVIAYAAYAERDTISKCVPDNGLVGTCGEVLLYWSTSMY